ncbi:MAG: acetyl-CoA carboxylase biotin carboxyl carrier protein [Cyanobacteria bacterium P01_H01_bin.15]
MAVDFQQLQAFVTAIAQTGIEELTLKHTDFELTLRKGTAVSSPGIAAPVAPVVPAVAAPAPTMPTEVVPTPVPPPAVTERDRSDLVEIASPMVGTFYRAPAPNEDPFVAPNERISQGQTVCIIEAMKLMNEIEAEVSGKIVEIVAENGEPVEYGQTLMWVSPD